MSATSYFSLLAGLVSLYGILLALLYTAWDRERRRGLRDGPLPRISVVVPARDPGEHLSRCLEGLAAQQYEGEVEFIVVDDGSRDATPQVLEAWKRKEERLKTVRLEDGTWPEDPSGRPLTRRQRALEAGVQRAEGEILLFLAAEAQPASSWVASHAAGFTSEVHVTAGPTLVTDSPPWREGGRAPTGTWSRFQEAESLLTSLTTAGGVAWGRPVPGVSHNWGVRRGIWDAVEGMRGIGRTHAESRALARQVARELGRDAVRWLFGTGAAVASPTRRGLRSFWRERRQLASEALRGGGLGALLAWTEWLLAVFFWGGLYVMATARPFAPIKFLGPYLGLGVVLGMFLEGSRSSVDSTLPRGVYPLHMIGRWVHVLLSGAAGLLPLPLRGSGRRE